MNNAILFSNFAAAVDTDAHGCIRFLAYLRHCISSSLSVLAWPAQETALSL